MVRLGNLGSHFALKMRQKSVFLPVDDGPDMRNIVNGLSREVLPYGKLAGWDFFF
jgi:hypothetical protein